MRISFIGFILGVLAIAGCAPTSGGGGTEPTIDINGDWLVVISTGGLQLGGNVLTIEGGQPTTLTVSGEAYDVDNSDPPNPNSDVAARITLTGNTFSMVVTSSGETFNFDGQVVDENTITGTITSPTSSGFEDASFTLTRQ